MNFLTYEFPVGKYPIGTQLDGIIQRYVKFSDGKEALILDNVHVIGQKPFPYTLQYAVSRTNAELVSRIYNTMENGIKALENAPMRLINLRYAVRGYGGIPHENRSWLFQPLHSLIKSGKDWYLI